MKKFISGLVIGAVVTTSVTAFGAGVIKNINASYNVNRLIVNGVDTGKGSTAFISNGTTYVPLRTVSDALGSDIKWDPQTRDIYITTKAQGGLENPTDLPIINNSQPAPAPVQPTQPVQPNVPQQQGSNNQKFIGIEKAKSIALNKFGGKVIAAKPDLYDDDFDHIPSYEIKVANGYKIYEVDVDAVTGAIISFDLDD